MSVTHTAEGQTNTWDLTWNDLALRLRLESGILTNDYFGPAESLTPPTAWPVPDPIQITRTEARIGLTPADRAVPWTLTSWSQPQPNLLVLTLRGDGVPLESELRFRVDAPTGLLRRDTKLTHTADGPSLAIASAQSLAALLPAAITDVTYLAGRLVAETQVQRLHLSQTPLYLESRAGKTGYRFQPYVALHAPTHTYLCELFWSGNWQLHVEQLPDGRVHLATGLNPWGLRHHLQPGDTLVLPEAVLGCIPGDLNAATQRLHDLRRRLRPDPDRHVPIHFNTWYPANERIPVDLAKDYARRAANLGCENIVVDAGWYTTELDDESKGWWSRTGDWVVDKRRFPNGLEELSDECRRLGIGFGIWFEPEAVGVDARVRREHPEWLHHIAGVAPKPDERAILHLGVPAARADIRERIVRVLRATDAKWMKWDFNTELDQGGWSPDLPADLTTQDPLIAHYDGLYQLQDELRAALPDLTFEMCAGGGSRFDGAIMTHAHTNWMSDQTQPLMNLAIHFGSHLAHPPVACNNWLIEWPPHDALHKRQWLDDRGDLPFRTRVAMLGTFGISAPLDQWPNDDVEAVKHHIAWYKTHVQPLLHNGDEYFLTEPPPLDGNGDWAAICYAAKDRSRAVLFAFRLAGTEATRSFSLPGLDPAAGYTVTPFAGPAMGYRGSALAAGLPVTTDAPFRSALFAIERT